MNRNTESHFSTIPQIDIQRSRFNRDSQHKTTLNTGSLIPIYVDEVLPGDTFSMDMSSVMRMSTPIFPVMDNLNADFYFFFVPNRLVWEHWKEFNGENTQTAWEQTIEYEIPQITAPEGGWDKGSIADYMGIPTNVEGISVNALPFRAYCLIWNEWFRDQNLKDPCMINLDDASTAGMRKDEDKTFDYVKNSQKGATPLAVAKYHDYFTSALPEPQKGPDVMVPLGQYAPVVTKEENAFTPTSKTEPLHWNTLSNGGPMPEIMQGYLTMIGSNGTAWGPSAKADTSGGINAAWPVNLYANLEQAAGASINQLRQAFAIQRLYEKDARGGTRYTEMIRAHFGVTSPDARQQRPEYLGGFRQPINIDQVLQTSSTDETSPQGNTAAYSLTNMSESLFTYSSTEHGFIIGLVAVRTEHTYQQGIERFWNRKQRFDYYYPALANIGEQAILNKEIYATGNSTDDEAFGYQEAWADYRYKPSRVSGAMRSNYKTTLDAWHFADYYQEQPKLSSKWINETKVNVDRTLAVQSSIEDQFICDFYFRLTCTRPMPLFSVPGLIDHH